MTYCILGMTQQEAIEAIRQQVGSGAGTDTSGAYAWMAAAALGLALVLLVMRWRRGRQVRRPVKVTLNDPRKLLKDLQRSGVVTRAEARALKRQASAMNQRGATPVQNPLTLALCPSLKHRQPRAARTV